MTTRTGSCPYTNLFIYHLEGIFCEEDGNFFGKEYLGNWVEDNYSFLFFSEDPGTDIEKIVNRQSNLSLLDKYSFSYEEWQGGGLKTIKIDDFLITPPWEDEETNQGEMRILMDPGVVFGTGLHPTTRDCLKAISYTKKNHSFNKVLDIGTGTGILAIASALLGAREVMAIDLNPLAIRTAKKNVGLNRLENVIKVYEGRAEDFLDGFADLVVANIHYEVIKSFFGRKGFFNKRHFIFSGLMRSQARDIKDMAARYDLKILKEWDHEMTWYTFLAGKE